MSERVDSTRVIQVTNLAPSCTMEQVKTLFSYLGKVRDVQMYPPESVDQNAVTVRVAYIEFDDGVTTGVSLHLNGTVFVDRALVIVPVMDGKIPDESAAMRLTPQAVAGMLPGQPTWPANVVSQMTGTGTSQVITTFDPKLTSLGLPQYPHLPATVDPNVVEEIRRTVYVSNLSSSVDGEMLITFFSKAGEVKYVCMAGEDAAYVEFTDQRSVAQALQLNKSLFKGKEISVQHSRTQIDKPQEREFPKVTSKRSRSKSKHRSRSRSRRRSRSRSKGRRRRSGSRSRRRSRSKHRSPKRSRSPRRKRSRSRGREVPLAAPARRSRSRDRRRSRSKSGGRRRRSGSTSRRKRSRTPPKSYSSKRSRSRSLSPGPSRSRRRSPTPRKRSHSRSPRRNKRRRRTRSPSLRRRSRSGSGSRHNRSRRDRNRRSRSRDRKHDSKRKSNRDRDRDRDRDERKKESSSAKVKRDYDEEEKGYASGSEKEREVSEASASAEEEDDDSPPHLDPIDKMEDIDHQTVDMDMSD